MADIRPPAVAGTFYPADPGVLRNAIDAYMAAATVPDLGRVCAVIAPHAGYAYSGPVAGYAYRLLGVQQPRPGRIIIMGPSHRSWFPGVAVADVDGFATPLGTQPVDRTFMKTLSGSQDLFSAANAPHTLEHCLEVQIPFIQAVLPDVPVVPMLFGEINPTEVGRELDRILEDTDLIIVSSDLSHFHNNRMAHTIDRQFLDALLAGDHQGVLKGEACGQAPALALMTIAESRNWHPRLLDYRTSGDISGDTRRVVGYAAVAYTEEF
ncbi:MAG: AmmeMemoRadiSam system protein B [Anaerolineae bacterium]|nr:AmmeMemoRadiSam system protein B [Anaerolineae bacterium]